ncbi:MAG: hypothetical protein J5507_03190 [Clostridia bacterium]|nr:hypothetical protein [Clostridia bacterium]
MGYKIKGALKKSKSVFIIFFILWVILSIVLTMSITVSIVEANGTGSNFIENFMANIGKVGENIGKSFNPRYITTFWKVELRLTAVLLICMVIGLIRSMPKNEYSGIENGSSDWASGEQYSALSKHKGILLAENHYLPVDKRGNTNVLVVGRIWFSENLHHMLFQMHINF